MSSHIKLSHKITFITTGILIILGLIISFILVPSVRYIFYIKHEIDITNSELEEQYQKIRLLKKSIQELDIIKIQAEEFKQATISKGNELAVIQQFEFIARKNNVDQNLAVSFVEKSKDVTREYYIFNFKIHGEYNNILHYMQDIERLSFYIITDAIILEKPNKQADTEHRLDLSFSDIIYSSN